MNTFFKKLINVGVVFSLVLGINIPMAAVALADAGTGTSSSADVLPITLPATRIGTDTTWTMSLTSDYTGGYVHPFWSITSGSLPPGMTLNQPSSGSTRLTTTITGRPTLYGSYPVTFMIDRYGNLSSAIYKSYVLVVNPMEITPVTLPNPRVQTAYSQALSIQGGTAPFRWDITGRLPVGLNLSASGVIAGTPLVAETTSFSVSVVDTNGNHTAREFTITSDPANVLSITTGALPSAIANAGYSTTISGNGGVSGYYWQLVEGSIPSGLTLYASSGVISGTPASPGTYNFKLRLTDGSGATADKSFVLTVAAAGSPTPIAGSPVIGATSLPTPVVGTWYGYNLGISGGTAPYTWTLVSGSVPVGLVFDAGSLYGTPTMAGNSTFTVKVADAVGGTAVKTINLSVNAGAGSPVTTPPTTPASPAPAPTATPGSDEALAVRLETVARMGLSVNALVKLPDDGNPITQEDSAVYYISTDGRRHAFPNSKVFFSWYDDFSGVRTIQPNEIANLPLGANATYHPGRRMVKFTTDNKVYVVDVHHTLRLIPSEAVAIALYGNKWNQQVDDIADTFYTDYAFGAQLNAATELNLEATRNAVSYLANVLP